MTVVVQQLGVDGLVQYDTDTTAVLQLGPEQLLQVDAEGGGPTFQPAWAVGLNQHVGVA